MRECAGPSEDLKAYLDRQLSLPRRLAVRLHLSRCASCREELEQMEHIATSIRARQAGEPLRPELKERILASVADAPTSGKLPRARIAWTRRQQLCVGIAGATFTWFLLYPLATHMMNGGGADLAFRTGSPAASGAAAAPQGPPVDAERAPAAASQPRVAASGVANTDQAGGKPEPVAMAQQTFHTPGMLRDMQEQYTKAHAPEQPGMMLRRARSATRAAGAATELNPPGSAAVAASVAERQVHREADITVEVVDVEQKSEAVSAMVTEAEGYVATNQLNAEGDTRTAEMVVKVPAGRFDSILTRLAKLGEVKAKAVNGEDVTEKVSDQEQQTGVLQADVTKLAATVRAHRTSADSEALRQLRIRAAQSAARLAYLRKFAALATINVRLTEKPKPAAAAPATSGFLLEMGQTAQDALHSFLEAAKLPVLLMIWLLAYAPVWILLAVVYRFAFRAR